MQCGSTSDHISIPGIYDRSNELMDFTTAVRVMNDISKEVMPRDGLLAREIQICAEKLRMKEEKINGKKG